MGFEVDGVWAGSWVEMMGSGWKSGVDKAGTNCDSSGSRPYSTCD